MKKIIVPMLLLFIPLVILAGVFDRPGNIRFRPAQTQNRAYRIAQQIYSSKDADQWVTGSRANFYYNSLETALPDSMHIDMYDPDSGEWWPAMMVAYIYYNGSGYVLENAIYMNMMGMMIPMMKTSAIYDDQNRIIKLYGYNGGDFEKSRDPEYWEPFSRLHIYYDGPAVSEVYSWEIWEEEFRTEVYYKSTFEFDDQYRIITEYTDESLDSLSWVADDKYTRTYHPNDTSTGLQFIEYMSQNLPFMLLNDGFDFPGMITEEIEYDWEEGAWVLSDKHVSEFNPQDQRTQTTEYYWNMDQWQESYRVLYSYYPHGNMASMIEQEYFDGNFVDSDKVDYIWETYTSNHDPELVVPADFGLKLYPIPFQTELNIETFGKDNQTMDIAIYNLRGQLLQSYRTQTGSTISWNAELDSRSSGTGIYFIKSQIGNRSNIYKVIKIR